MASIRPQNRVERVPFATKKKIGIAKHTNE